MKLISPGYEIWEQSLEETQEKLLNGVYRQIEKAGRVCYKSEDRITDNSAPKFVKQLVDAKHYAMLEHGTIYLHLHHDYTNYAKEFKYSLCKFTAPYNWSDVVASISIRYQNNNYSKVNIMHDQNGTDVYITTNYRVIIENHWEDDLQWICTPTEYHKKRVTVHFICNRQVSHEFVRHKLFCVA